MVDSWGGVQYTSVGRLLKQIIDAYPGDSDHLYITSSYRSHTPGSHHGGRLSYAGSRTAAIDIGFGYPSGNTNGGRALANWLLQFQSDTVELIHTPGSFFVKNGRRVGPYAASAHYDHVHFACSEAQARRILAKLKRRVVATASRTPQFSRSVGSIQKEVNLAGYKPPLKRDRRWGPKTEAGVKWYQRLLGVTADGVWGPITEKAHQARKAKNRAARNSRPSSGGGTLAVDGDLGPKTISEMQRQLNKRLGA